MRIHEDAFYGAVRRQKVTHVANELGFTQPWLSEKLKDPQRLRISDFVGICKILGRDPMEFLIFDKKEKSDVNV